MFPRRNEDYKVRLPDFLSSIQDSTFDFKAKNNPGNELSLAFSSLSASPWTQI